MAGRCDTSRFVMSETIIYASRATGWCCLRASSRTGHTSFGFGIVIKGFTLHAAISRHSSLPLSPFPTRFDNRPSRDGVTTAGDTYNFGVPSSNFHMAWRAHSGAISSVSWIDSPASLLSTSADGLAKIWSPDGNILLGQVGVTLHR